MVQVKVGITTKVNKYYHEKDCYDAYVEEEKFKKKEAKEKDSLVQTVMDIYDVKALPNTFYMQMEGLRHGNRLFSRQKIGRRYREGYEYNLIEESYLYSKDSIDWSLENKAFVNLSNALNYGLTIVINNMYNVELIRDTKRNKEHMEELSNNVKGDSIAQQYYDSSYKKAKEDEHDISFLLDD